MIRTFDRALFFHWAKIFCTTLVVVATLILVERIYDALENLINLQANRLEMALYFSGALARLLPVIIPAALLFSTLFTLITMHGKREITALRAAGLGVMTITRSLWFGGALCALLVFVLTAWLAPRAVDTSEMIYRNLQFRSQEAQVNKGTTASAGAIRQLAFYNQREGRLWFFDRFNARSLSGNRVHLYTFYPSGNRRSHTQAREAYFDDIEQQWTFIDGSTLHYPERDIERDAMFVEAFTILRPEGLVETPYVMMAMMRKPGDLSLNALKRLLATEELRGSPALAPFRAKMLEIITAPAMCLVVVGLAIPFSIRGVRSNPIVGASQALILFFFYYLIINAFTILGARSIMDPSAAAWAPHLILASCALFLNLTRE